MDENNVVADEKNELSEYLKSLKNLMKFMNDFQNIKTKDSDAIEKFEKTINRMPKSDVLCSALEEYKISCEKFINETKSIRIKEFKKHETSYIKDAKAQGKIVREYSEGWRIDRLQLHLKPELSKCRVLYNNEVVINWSNINSKDDFIKIEDKANNMLDEAAISEEQLIELLWEAYVQGINRLSGKSNSTTLPIQNLYKEFRIALIRKQLEEKKFTAKINKYLEFPLWCFLYNLDLYRTWGSKIPANKRIVLQTGSMQETSQGKGFIVNGINANEEYKVMCYVYAFKEGAAAR